jgi:hypothetical protein
MTHSVAGAPTSGDYRVDCYCFPSPCFFCVRQDGRGVRSLYCEYFDDFHFSLLAPIPGGWRADSSNP